MTKQENLENMKRCPRWISCDIPKCPLDFYMSERTELPKDEVCVLRGTQRTKRVKGSKTQAMRGLSNFIWEKNRK